LHKKLDINSTRFEKKKKKEKENYVEINHKQ